MPFTNGILERNIIVAIREAYIQAAHAKSVATRARTGYYKLSVLLMASTVEALLYHLIETKIAANPSLVTSKQYKHLKRLHTVVPGASMGISKNLVMCEEVSDNFQLSDKVMFKQLSVFCRDAGLITTAMYHEIDYVLKKRNEIHLQGLTSVNRTFTAAMLERVSIVTIRLYTLI